MDAFAAAMAQGAATRPNPALALRMGAAFGFAQGVMPLFGWALGLAFASVIIAVGHWVALVLLGFLGLRMMREGILRKPSDVPPVLSSWRLAILAIATSVDAALAGITLPILGAPIFLACAMIGMTTAVLSGAGVYLGAFMGERLGKWAEVAGGLILLGLGLKIFIGQQFLGG